MFIYGIIMSTEIRYYKEKAMMAIPGEFIFDLLKTEVDFLNDVNYVYVNERGLWFKLFRYTCNIWVQAMGDGRFNLYRVPLDFDFDLETAEYEYNLWAPEPQVVARDIWDTRCPTSFSRTVESLLKK